MSQRPTVLVLSLVLLAGCAGSTPAPSSAPSPTPVSVVTASPSPTPTPTPDPTPTPTPVDRQRLGYTIDDGYTLTLASAADTKAFAAQVSEKLGQRAAYVAGVAIGTITKEGSDPLSMIVVRLRPGTRTSDVGSIAGRLAGETNVSTVGIDRVRVNFSDYKMIKGATFVLNDDLVVIIGTSDADRLAVVKSLIRLNK